MGNGDNIESMEQEIKRRLHTLVGELLAQGCTNGEILEHLQTEQTLTLEESQVVLRGVFDSWISVREGLDLHTEDDKNWHLHLRMKLLQSTLRDPSTPAQRLALQILDSLSTIQGITPTLELSKPLPIILVEKKEKPDEQNG